MAANNGTVVRLHFSQFLQAWPVGLQLRHLAKAEVSAGRYKAPSFEGTGKSKIKLQTCSGLNGFDDFERIDW